MSVSTVVAVRSPCLMMIMLQTITSLCEMQDGDQYELLPH